MSGAALTRAADAGGLVPHPAVAEVHPAVAEARRWIGTPYVHQASILGAGCDCLGLVRGVWRALHGCEPEALPAYTPDWGEAAGSELLLQGALRHLVPVDPAAPLAGGQVIVFRMIASANAKHLGIASRADGDLLGPAFIHAYDRHGVLESPLSRPWAARIAARFAFPARRPDRA